ncbi:hypothetical protein ACFQ48_06155 [Hymenobacter caeli]|uniref:ElaB/YqjD/DUF883 family membrane-anchored ribosome-binding protein n=1 Tax=Hymenobacter caeli TaxID=2735894 RepID=A0ABX2FNL4_9BACT|nr:hypothetical protein [Hymenobacter caeli]NRT18762.1 ElaB/YqjD/DUF883 family membrane-anchored ribosome-binding protein [Hymenobacter caeli]
MKASIDTIASFLDGNLLEMAKDARDKLGEYEHAELTIKEAYSTLKLLLDQLKASIEKGYLERVSQSRRVAIGAQMTIINQALDMLNQHKYESNYQSKQYQSQYIQGVYGLKDAVDDAKLFEMSKSFGNYYSSLEKLSITENQYQEILSKISGTEELYESSYSRLELLNEKLELAEKASEELEILKSTGEKNEIKIDGFLDNAKEYVQDMEDRRGRIESFHKNIEDMEEAVEKLKEENIKSVSNTKKNLQDFFEKSHANIDKAIKKTDGIIADNESLKEQVAVLLQGATAGRLNAEFKTESTKISNELRFWLAGVIIINILLLCFSCLMIFGSTVINIPAIDLKSLTAVAFVKIFLTIPILLLDWFMVRQYNIRRELMEKYTFKSLVSISLVHYNELIKQHIENEEAAAFIISAIDKIYSSPFDLPDTKMAAAINAFAEKGTGILEKAVEKVIDKVK